VLPISEIFLLSAVVGVLGLDATGALQVMVSRPLVVAGITGLMLGNPAVGLAVGSLVELLWMGGVPIGSLVPPDGTIAAAMAAAVAITLGKEAVLPGSTAAASALGVLVAVPVGVLGARSEVLQRVMTNRISRRADAELEAGKVDGIGRLMAAALGLALLRGFLVCGACLALGLPTLGWILYHLPADAVRALRWCFWLFWLLGLAVAANHFWERRGLKTAAAVALMMAVLGTQFDFNQPEILGIAVAAAALAGLWRLAGARRGETA
jgi:PTS system mannose-specific IIC component